MNIYLLMLLLHFLFMTAAVAAAALVGYAALRLRAAETVAEASRWGAFVEKVKVTFPIASLGLIGSGAYMTYKVWSWSTPWVVAGLAGLIAIMLLGAGVEGGRARATRAELRAAGLSRRARRLLRDPLAWSAKVTTWTLVLAVIFLMTFKPSAGVSAATLVVALVAGVLGAMPFWAGAPAGAGPSTGTSGSGLSR